MNRLSTEIETAINARLPALMIENASLNRLAATAAAMREGVIIALTVENTLAKENQSTPANAQTCGTTESKA